MKTEKKTLKRGLNINYGQQSVGAELKGNFKKRIEGEARPEICYPDGGYPPDAP